MSRCTKKIMCYKGLLLRVSTRLLEFGLTLLNTTYAQSPSEWCEIHCLPVRMDWSTLRVVDLMEVSLMSAGTLSPTIRGKKQLK